MDSHQNLDQTSNLLEKGSESHSEIQIKEQDIIPVVNQTKENNAEKPDDKKDNLDDQNLGLPRKHNDKDNARPLIIEEVLEKELEDTIIKEEITEKGLNKAEFESFVNLMKQGKKIHDLNNTLIIFLSNSNFYLISE